MNAPCGNGRSRQRSSSPRMTGVANSRDADRLGRQDDRMISDRTLSGMAERICAVPGVVGVVLGGSRAAGTHTPESDVDLGLYYRRPLDIDALGELARDIADERVTVSPVGGWGPWVDGGGWLTIDGTPVDWIYRELDRVRDCWREAQAGRFDFHFQVGHPFGVPDFAYPGELALSVILADPRGELGPLKTATERYPEALAVALVERIWEAEFILGGARKALSRNDATYLAGCLFRVVLLCCHALHGHAGRWLVNEKGAVRSTAKLPNAPVGFESRAQGLLGNLGVTEPELSTAIDRATALVADVAAAVRG